MNVGQQVLCWKKPWHTTQSLHCQRWQAHRHQSHQEQPKPQDFFKVWFHFICLMEFEPWKFTFCMLFTHKTSTPCTYLHSNMVKPPASEVPHYTQIHTYIKHIITFPLQGISLMARSATRREQSHSSRNTASTDSARRQLSPFPSNPHCSFSCLSSIIPRWNRGHRLGTDCKYPDSTGKPYWDHHSVPHHCSDSHSDLPN